MTIRDKIDRLIWEIQQANTEIAKLRADCSHTNYRTIEHKDVSGVVGYTTMECLDCLYRWRELG